MFHGKSRPRLRIRVDRHYRIIVAQVRISSHLFRLHDTIETRQFQFHARFAMPGVSVVTYVADICVTWVLSFDDGGAGTLAVLRWSRLFGQPGDALRRGPTLALVQVAALATTQRSRLGASTRTGREPPCQGLRGAVASPTSSERSFAVGPCDAPLRTLCLDAAKSELSSIEASLRGTEE